MQEYYNEVIAEARNDTNSSTFSYGDRADVNQSAPAPRPYFSFRDFPGYADQSRHAEEARQREEERIRQTEVWQREREAHPAMLMQVAYNQTAAG